ncbi:MAG: CRTAC1 family protein [Candidatus Sumerlaeaceae bacterium]|nr:CRTAC1 family protein [Candidatus Sumerlaeaceae bacterium]
MKPILGSCGIVRHLQVLGAASLLLLAGPVTAATFTEQGASVLIESPASPNLDAISCSFADIDNDGDPDLLIQGASTARRMFLNNKIPNGIGSFTKITTGPVNSADGTGWSACWGDYDSDGRIDVFEGQANNGGGSASSGDLYRNLGGSFSNVSASTINDPGFHQNVAWCDIDKDGDLDLLIGMEGPELHQVYIQNNSTSFTQAGATMGMQVPYGYKAYGMAIGDSDGDGDFDVYISTCISTQIIRNNFFRNDISTNSVGRAFVDIADSNGTQYMNNSYSCGFYDFDNDGDLDLLMAGADGWASKIFRNNGSNNFTDVDTLSTHPLLSNQGGDFNGAQALDYDNDGDLDLYFHDHLSSGSFNQARRLYRNDGNWQFTDVTVAEGLGGTNEGGYDSAWADFDLDGDLDLAFPTGSTAPERFFTSTVSTNGNKWLYVKLQGLSPNTRAIGAQIYVTIFKSTVNEKTLRRDCNTNANAFHQDDLPVHFGLGSATIVDELKIVWPNGTQRILTNVAVNQRLNVAQFAASVDDWPLY